MAGNELQVIGAELERVSDKVPTLFEREDTFFSQISKRPVEIVSSRDMRVPLELRPGGKSGFYNPDGGDLGRGGMPTWDKALVNTVHMRHAVEITAKSVWGTDNKRKAVINAFQKNLADGMKEFRRFLDSQCMGDGTGVIGTISAVTANAGYDTYTLNSDGFGARLVRYNQDINVFNSTLATNRTAAAEVTVTMHDSANKQINVTPNVTGAVAGDLLVCSGLTSTPPQGLLGVKYHHSNSSTGTWLGFDRALTPEIRSNRVSGNNSALTLPLPRLAMNKIGDRIGKKAVAKCKAWTHPAQQQAYEELGMNVNYINKGAKEEGLNLYFNDNMQIAGAPLMTHYSWDRTRIDFVNEESWGRAEFHPAGFYTSPDDGKRVWELRGPSGGVAAAWIFYLVASFQLFMNNPASGAYIDLLAVPAGY